MKQMKSFMKPTALLLVLAFMLSFVGADLTFAESTNATATNETATVATATATATTATATAATATAASSTAAASVAPSASPVVKDTVKVHLRVEDVNKTLVNKDVEITKADVETFNAEQAAADKVAIDKLTAKVALFKEFNVTAAKAVQYSYGNPSVIPGEETLKDSYYWSYRVNNEAPTDPATKYGYNLDKCPIKDGDSIVLFRQGCYDKNVAPYGAYTNYTFFDKDEYELSAPGKLDIKYTIQGMDKNGANVNKPGANEKISISYEGKTVEATTETSGVLTYNFDKTGTYELSAKKFAANGILENSRAYAKVVVKTTETKTSSSTKVKKPAAPKKLKVKVKGKKVKFSWKKVSKATGYDIFVSKKNKKKFKKVKSLKKVKYSKKYKKGTYFVKVRAYVKKRKKAKKVTGKFSKVVKFKVK